MILEDATKEAYGYYPSALSHGSAKPILAACDNCGKFKMTSKHHYYALCNSCAKKGMEFTEEHKHRMREAHKGKKHHMFGKHHSEETRKKMSEVHKVKNLSEETRKKISEAQKGRKHTEETKRRIGEAQKGKHPSEETNRKISEAHKGVKNYNWRGGISFEPYCIKFNKEYKTMIRNRFNNECFLCNKTAKDNGKALDVHHTNYDKRCDCNGEKCICVPLCHRCHMKTNTNRDYWQNLIMNKLKETFAG